MIVISYLLLLSAKMSMLEFLTRKLEDVVRRKKDVEEG